MSPVKTVDRAIDLLECFTPEQPELSVTQLATRLAVDKSAASRLAATLRSRKFLDLNQATRRYRIGGRLHELGRLFVARESLAEVAAPHLQVLVREVGHASHVGVLDRNAVLIVACVESQHRLQVAVQVGEHRAAHATAAGKLFLAHGTDEFVASFCRNGRFPKVGPKTIETLAEMRKELAAIRDKGIARNVEESLRGVGAIAAPILSSEGAILASLTTIFPLAVVGPNEFDRIGTHVRRAAARISSQLAASASHAPGLSRGVAAAGRHS
jgi:DNA-binding IclR family transcriptional regulator